MLQRHDVMEYLQTNFGPVPIDKEANSIAIICKGYYVKII